MKKKNVTKWAAGALLATSFLAVSISSIASAKEEFVIRDGVPILNFLFFSAELIPNIPNALQFPFIFSG
ncbi:MAG TPA: hypothetical protein H9959_13390, partial [Candidatus Mediterraneibacter ornithocaccae]|nr:hypothetical protein [Candidatus Mediterraneibacter ornithocaccae]